MSTTAQQQDDLLIEVLATGHGVAAAATAAGVSSRTVYRRLANASFAAKLAAARAERWRPRESRLLGEFDRSLDALIALRDAAANHPSTRLRAAQAVAELALRVSKITDFGDEIAKLHRLLADNEARQKGNDSDAETVSDAAEADREGEPAGR